MHWYPLYELEQTRLRRERDQALVRQANHRAAREALERDRQGARSTATPAAASPAASTRRVRAPRRWTLRVPRLAVTITLDPEAR